jgi:hypothetical protein
MAQITNLARHSTGTLYLRFLSTAPPAEGAPQPLISAAATFFVDRFLPFGTVDDFEDRAVGAEK